MTFRFNHRSGCALLHEGDRIAGVKCGDEIIKGDAYVDGLRLLLDGEKRVGLKGWWICRSATAEKGTSL